MGADASADQVFRGCAGTVWKSLSAPQKFGDRERGGMLVLGWERRHLPLVKLAFLLSGFRMKLCPVHSGDVPGVKLFLILVAWCLLLVVCWPLALAVLVLFPVVWLVALPFRLLALVVHAVFAFLRALLLLPARILSFGRKS